MNNKPINDEQKYSFENNIRKKIIGIFSAVDPEQNKVDPQQY